MVAAEISHLVHPGARRVHDDGGVHGPARGIHTDDLISLDADAGHRAILPDHGAALSRAVREAHRHPVRIGIPAPFLIGRAHNVIEFCPRREFRHLLPPDPFRLDAEGLSQFDIAPHAHRQRFVREDEIARLAEARLAAPGDLFEIFE